MATHIDMIISILRFGVVKVKRRAHVAILI